MAVGADARLAFLVLDRPKNTVGGDIRRGAMVAAGRTIVVNVTVVTNGEVRGLSKVTEVAEVGFHTWSWIVGF